MSDGMVEKVYNGPIDILDDGVEFLEKDELDNALIAFNTLANNYEDNQFVSFYLGVTHMRLGNIGLARILFKDALRICPEFPEALNNMGFVYHEQGDYKQAAHYFEEGLKIHPDSDDLLNNLATIYVNNGTPAQAVEWADKALKINPNHANARWNRALALLELGEWEEGFRDYEIGQHEDVQNRKKRTYSNEVNIPTWDGEKGKNVVVYGEQGLGDEIMFASCLPDAMKDANIILDCHPRLQHIFRNSFPDLKIYGTRKEYSVIWPAWEKIDAAIQIGSLPKLYRKKDEDFPKTPYLKPDRMLLDYYSEKLAEINDKPKVVIAWHGGTLKTNRDYRSMPLEAMAKFIVPNKDDYEFISLQYTKDADKEVAAFNEKHGTNIHHWPSTVADMDEQCALIAASDLVISVCTTIVHLSGALGKDCWCLCPSRPAWRYGISGPMPWYNSVKMYRQVDADWDTVLDKVKEDLC